MESLLARYKLCMVVDYYRIMIFVHMKKDLWNVCTETVSCAQITGIVNRICRCNQLIAITICKALMQVFQFPPRPFYAIRTRDRS